MKCWVCGKPNAKYTRDITSEYAEKFSCYTFQIRLSVKDEHQRCYCKNCFDSVMKQKIDENKEYIRLRHKRMFENALDKMERQRINFYEYEEAIKTIEEYNIENEDKFDSSYEIMVAIVLIHNHIHIKPQAKIGKYQVDFMLPDDHVILEIDGDRHKHRKEYDTKRDSEIKQELGKDWHIIRVNTEHLDKDVTKIVRAIEFVLDYRYSGKVNWRAI